MAARIDQPAGANAFTSPDPVTAPEPAPQPRRGRKKIGAGWNASNKPVTFYCPLDLYERLMAEAAGDRSKTQIIVDALRVELDLPEPGE